MNLMKKIFASMLLCIVALSFVSCSDSDGNSDTNKKDGNISSDSSEIDSGTNQEAEVEIIYAKTPEEAAEKCLDAIYSGNLDDAKHYVDPKGNAFKELTETKSKIMTSLDADSSEDRKNKVDKYILNLFSKFSYTQKEVSKKDETSTVVYSVSMPDMGSFNYSTYMDSYMSANGISYEEFFSAYEKMTKEEADKWAVDFQLDVMNYVLENNLEIPMIGTETTVYLKKGNEGWIVTDIKNLAS